MVTYFDPEPSNPKPLNGAQFSQGSLFKMPPSDEHRWPRGYTPERQAEVASNIRPDKVYASVDVPNVEGSRYRPRSEYEPPRDRASVANAPYRQDTPAATSMEIKQRAVVNQKTHAHHNVVDSVARTSMPAWHARTVGLFRIDQLGENTAGQYRSFDKIVEMNPQKGRTSGVEEDRVLTHEIGHHTDYMLNREHWDVGVNERVKPNEWSTPASPSLEGAAEGYAYKHGMNQRRGEIEVPYDRTLAYRGFHDDDRFKKRFHEVSGTRLEDAVPQPKSRSAYGGSWSRGSATAANRMPHLFSRLESSEHTSIERDFGQYKLEADWGDKDKSGYGPTVDTIKVGRGVPHDVMREGFKKGDHMIIDDLKRNSGPGQRERWRGGSFTAKDQRRVESTWQRHYPGTDIGHSGA